MPNTQANILLDIYVIVNWQLSNRVSTDQGVAWLYRGVKFTTHWSADMFFYSYPAVGFNWLQAQVHNEKAI